MTALPPPPDDLEMARGGSRDAFCRLVRTHQAAVRAYIGRYMRHHDVVEDLAQEVFLAAHRGLATFRGDAPFRMWLLAVARRQVALYFRSRQRAVTSPRDRLDELLERWRHEHFDADEDRLSTLDGQVEALRACLDRLPADGAALISAYYARDESAVQIAARAGRNVDAVRMSLMRLRRSLRACIERRMAAAQGAT